MLLEGKYKGDMTIYRNPELWVDYFNGIYIKPAQEDPSGEGNLFATNLAESGLLMYTRSRNRTDPTLIQDTITASYLFYREDDPYGNVSINTIRHDYTGSKINPADIDERNEQRPLNPNVYVEGMDGVITELTLTDALFEGIEALYKEVTDKSGMPYTSIAINQAELMIYLEKSDYDWEKMTWEPSLPCWTHHSSAWASMPITSTYWAFRITITPTKGSIQARTSSCRTEVTSTAAKAVMSWTSPVTCRRYGTAT